MSNPGPIGTRDSLEAAAAVLETRVRPASDADLTVDDIWRTAGSLLQVLWWARDISQELLEQAEALASGEEPEQRIVAALPHHSQLVKDLHTAWRTAFQIGLEIQPPDLVKRKFLDAERDAPDDDDPGWVRIF